ncbi:MAG: SAM-dependent methyltransferase [Gammaproteobacteria bacterium]|jgi:SAM-dependent methyltransferase
MSEKPVQQPDWESRYQEKNTPWDRGSASQALLNWLKSGQLEPCRILVPGCGNGHEVVHLCRLGFDVTAIDVSPSAMEVLQNRLNNLQLSAKLVAADFFDWHVEVKYAAIYEQTSLCALPPDQWQDYVNLLGQWLEPGGILFGLFMQTGKTGGPPWHCDLITMQQLFKPPIWQWQTTNPESLDHPAGLHELMAKISRSAQ